MADQESDPQFRDEEWEPRDDSPPAWLRAALLLVMAGCVAIGVKAYQLVASGMSGAV